MTPASRHSLELQTYLRMLESEAEKLRRAAHTLPEPDLRRLRQHLRNIRLATGDVERSLRRTEPAAAVHATTGIGAA